MTLARPFAAVTPLACLLLVMIASPVVLGQTESQPDLTNISIEELARVKVYSASKHLENSEDAPSAVTVITAEEIKSFGWRTLADAIRSVRGFYTAYDRDYVYVGVRGVLQPGNYNTRILLLINGHRVNDNVYDSAHFGTEFPLDLDVVERIEIVRGPSSSLFGTNAFFGIINVITRKVHGGASLELTGESLSWLGRSVRATTTFQRGRLTGLLSGSILASDGHPHLYFPEFDSTGTNLGIADHLDNDRYAHGFGDIQYGRFRLQGLFSNRVKDVPTAPLGTQFNSLTTSRDRRSYFDIGYHRPLSSTTDLDLRGYLDDYLSYAEGTLAANDYMPATHGYWMGSSDWFGTEATLGKKLGKHRLTAGGQYEYSVHVRQKTQAAGMPPVVDEDTPQQLAAIYGQAELRLAPKLAINAGLRYDWFSTYSGSISPRVALVYSFSNKTALKYIYGRAFRAPNAYENWYDDGLTRERPSPALKSEHIQSQDVILESHLRPWMKLSSEFFYNQLSALIDQRVDYTTGRLVFANAGHFKSRGVGAEIEVSTKSGIRTRASYLLADSDDVSGNQLPNTPVHTIKLNGSIPLKRVTAGLELQYASSQETSQGYLVRASTLTNLTLSTKPIWRGLELSASCYNAFDRRWYSPPAAYEPRIRQIEQDGRNFRFRLSRRFNFREERGGE